MLFPSTAPTAVEVVRSRDVDLHVEHFEPRNAPRLAVALVHGLGLHGGLYRHVGAALADNDIVTTVFDCRGHGLSSGPRGHVDQFGDYLTDLNEVTAHIRGRWPDTPLALIGHSLGALVVLSQAVAAPEWPTCAVAVSPWIDLHERIKAKFAVPAKAFRRLRPALAMTSFVESADLSDDPTVIAAFDADPLIHHTITAGCFANILDQQAKLLSSSARLDAPTLVLGGERDQVISLDAAASFFRRAAREANLRLYPSSGHGLFFESEWREVVAELATWLLGTL